MKRDVAKLLLVQVSLLAGCATHSSSAVRQLTAPRTQNEASRSAAPDEPSRPAQLAAATQSSPDAFLVHTFSGGVELRSVHGGTSRVLAPNADSAMYDHKLELLWIVQESRISVIDLRATSSAPVEIVRGMPEVSTITIRRKDSLVSTNDGCQGPSFTLNWKEPPSVEAYDRDTEDTQIVGGAWLQSNFGRPTRASGNRIGFTDERRARLPRKLLDCDEAGLCAATAKFGSEGLQLVLVHDKSGGDCWNRACVVLDPQKNRYASPSDLGSWTSATKVRPGSCGLYYFDESDKLFLSGSRLCTIGASCEKLGGLALGWLQSGDIVGDIGSTGDEDEDEDGDAE